MLRLIKVLKIFAVNMLILLVGIIIIELIWGSWFSNTHALYQFTKPRNARVVQDNPIGGEPGKVSYTRDANGFRGLDAPLGAIDIITVGGSTSDQRYLDDSRTFQAVLKRLFAEQGRKVVIANAGIDGQSTIGHIYNFSSWFEKIDGLKTRYILYYIGINDALRDGEAELYDKVGAQSAVLRLQLYIREKSVFYQLYLVGKRYFNPVGLVHGRSPHIAEGPDLVEKPTIGEYKTKEVSSRLAALQTRVKKLNELTRQFGAKSIFVTQRSARWNIVDGKLVGIRKWLSGPENEFNILGELNGVDIYHVESLVANAIMEECQRVQAICIDLMKGIKFRNLRQDFYDAVHTTNSGSDSIARYLFVELRGKLK